jgi:hypothetical protein
LEKVDIFYGHLEYFTDIWNFYDRFGTFCVHLVHFSSFGIMNREKSGNPGFYVFLNTLQCFCENLCNSISFRKSNAPKKAFMKSKASSRDRCYNF